ncbi:MAG TPA: hypothetical protein VNO70_21390, partial [Blastocatellia bacterium]|nr:hypothetical protein [Blastocatellia bacterium]
MHRKTLLLFVISAMTCLTAYADQIKLKNGDRLTGKVVKSDGKTLTLKADIVGIVSIPVEAIEHISSDQPLYFSIEDGRTVKGSVTTKKDKLEVNTKESGKITVARDAVKAIRSQAEQDAYLAETRTGWLNHWSGFVQTGFSLTAGNSDTQTLTL